MKPEKSGVRIIGRNNLFSLIFFAIEGAFLLIAAAVRQGFFVSLGFQPQGQSIDIIYAKNVDNPGIESKRERDGIAAARA
jgi:hypothetical protein